MQSHATRLAGYWYSCHDVKGKSGAALDISRGVCYSMNEAGLPSDKIDRGDASEKQHPLPSNGGAQSPLEIIDKGDLGARTDPKTAHEAVGDTDWSSFIPASCLSCLAQELAESAVRAENSNEETT